MRSIRPRGSGQPCGAQRYAFNWGLARIKANLDQRAAERSYVILDDQLTPSVSWSAYRLRKDWNRVKAEVAPWWGEHSKEAYSSGLANLATALTNWQSSRSGARRGSEVRFPRFKGRRAGLSCRFTTGSSRIRSATVSYRCGRWVCSFSVEITRIDPAPTRTDTVVGVDLGVKSLAVLSTGEVIAGPRHLEVALRELRRLQRQASRRRGPDRRTSRNPSNQWRRTWARIARLHARVANARHRKATAARET